MRCLGNIVACMINNLSGYCMLFKFSVLPWYFYFLQERWCEVFILIRFWLDYLIIVTIFFRCIIIIFSIIFKKIWDFQQKYIRVKTKSCTYRNWNKNFLNSVNNVKSKRKPFERRDSWWQKLNGTCEGHKDPNNLSWRLSRRVDV